MQDHATVFQAESEATTQACTLMEDNHNLLKPNYVKILTDSQAQLKALDCLDFKSTISFQAVES